ncbi:hypothetical protein J4Q44_G00006370, partial [Coregonus suidteri]
ARAKNGTPGSLPVFEYNNGFPNLSSLISPSLSVLNRYFPCYEYSCNFFFSVSCVLRLLNDSCDLQRFWTLFVVPHLIVRQPRMLG